MANTNSDQMDMLMGPDDDDSAAPSTAPAPQAGPKMVSINMPIDVAQNLMDEIGQQLSAQQPQAPAGEGQEDLTSPGAGEAADEEQLEAE